MKRPRPSAKPSSANPSANAFNRLVSLAGALAALALAVVLAAAPARAAAPEKTLVMAKDIADIITLDPAEVFELTTGEIIANLYDRILMFEPEEPGRLVGGVAESYTVSGDGKAITFRIRDGLRFHSGNPVRPEDVEFSLERAVKLNRTPAFILTQFGWNADNVGGLIEVVDAAHVRVVIAAPFSPGVVLNALSAGIASVVDRELVLAHERDGDMGYGWLTSNSAGSGPFRLARWKANDSVVLDAYPGYRRGAPGVARVVLRHVPDPSAQRRLLENGDVDMARNLTPDEIRAAAAHPEVAIDRYAKGTVIYLAANASHPILGKPEVVQALRHAVDYRGMAGSFLTGQYTVHQAFLPRGMWAAHTGTPYWFDPAKAKALLAGAGHGDGFDVQIDTIANPPYPAIARSVQATFGQVGIRSRITTHDGKAFLLKYRARRHELVLAPWSPDYLDPHSNAESFAYNPDNRLEAKLGGMVAWRNAWAPGDINAMTVAARNEPDPARRRQLYLELQQRLQTEGPFVILFQQNEQVARRRNVAGFAAGLNFDQVFYRNVSK